MKTNTNETKAALQKALAQVPQDHALSEVRYHIRAALGKLETVEKKRDRREVSAERRELARGQGNAYAFDPFRAIQAIDEEIAKEKAKIENIQRRRTQVDDEKDDGDELQTVFG
jgi:hypothetical protein